MNSNNLRSFCRVTSTAGSPFSLLTLVPTAHACPAHGFTLSPLELTPFLSMVGCGATQAPV